MSIRVQNPNGRVKIDIEGGDAGDCADYVGPWVISPAASYSGLGYGSIAFDDATLSVSDFSDNDGMASIAPGALSISAHGLSSTFNVCQHLCVFVSRTM